MKAKNNNSSYFKKGQIPWNKGTGEMAEPKICKHCNKKFYNRVKTRKFCCHHCSTQYPISEETRKKLSKYHKNHPNRYWLGKNNPHTTGKNNNNWNGGKTSREGYNFTLSIHHPNRNNENYVRDSRLVAEKCLGRYLLLTEIIHHINGITDDDRPENLYLFPNINEHSRYHGYSKPPILTSNLIIKEQN